MQKEPLRPLADAYRLLSPGSVVLVSVGDATRDNLLPVAWNMPVDTAPGLLAIVCGSDHFSYPLLTRTGEFGVNVPDASLADALLGCGRVSGRDVEDKFARFRLDRQAGTHIAAPLVANAPANLECRVHRLIELEGAALVIGEVLEAWIDPRHFQHGRWSFANGLKLLHHLGGDEFCVSDRSLTAHVPS